MKLSVADQLSMDRQVFLGFAVHIPWSGSYTKPCSEEYLLVILTAVNNETINSGYDDIQRRLGWRLHRDCVLPRSHKYRDAMSQRLDTVAAYCAFK